MNHWAAEMLGATSVLIALVLVVRGAVARQFGARAAYALWLAPLLRFVVPPMTSPMVAPQVWIETSNAAASTLAPVSATVPLGTVLVAVWLSGAMLFLVGHLIAYRRFVAGALHEATALTEDGIDDAAILASDAVTGPAAAGLLVRRIFVPRDFTATFSPEECRIALRHEVLHHRRGDLWASAVALACLAFHWFNPLAYVAHRAFRRDLEAACDADLLSRPDAPTRQAYARTILRCVARPVPHPVCALTNNDELKGRIAMMKHDHNRTRRLTGTSLAALLATGGLMLALPATAAQETAPVRTEVRTDVRKVIRIGGPAGGRSDILVADCPGEKFEATAGAEGAATKKTKILLCGKPGATKAQSADSLERAIARIEGEAKLPLANKAQIIAALKAKVAELRASN